MTGIKFKVRDKEDKRMMPGDDGMGGNAKDRFERILKTIVK